MQDQRDHGLSHAIEDASDGLQVAEIDIERTQRGDDDEVWQDESPSSGPCAPEAAAQIGDVDADLDRKRSGKRLADGNSLAHLLLRQPLLSVDEFALHLANQGHRPTEAQ